MARARDEYTVKFRLLDDWHYDVFKAENPEHASRLFWARMRDMADEDGMVTFRTGGGLTQVKLTAITGIVVQK